MSSKCWSGSLQESGGFWLGFWFLIMMGMGQQCPKQPIFQNLAKNPHVLEVLIGFVEDCGGSWLGFWFLMGMGQQCPTWSILQISVFYIEFKGAKNPHVMLEDSGGSWLGFQFLIMMGTGQQCPKWPIFQISVFYIEFKGTKNPHVLEVPVGVVEDSGGSWLGFWFSIMMGMGQQYL